MGAPNPRLQRQIRQLATMQALKAQLAYAYPLEAEELWRRALELSEGDVDGLADAVEDAVTEFLSPSPLRAAGSAPCVAPLPPLLTQRT